MELVLVIGIVFLIAALLAWITKIDIAYLFAPATFFISGWELIFGLLGYLNLGMKSLLVCIGITVSILLIKNGGFRSQLFRSLLAPSTIAFVSLSMISLYKSKDWLLSIWDELSHWGVFPKAMYEYAALAPATPVDLWNAKYPPGISLFQYFVLEFSEGWREGLLFWSMHLLVISIIVSALAKCTYKYPSEILLKLFIALVASSAFLNGFDTIYQDAILALAFGFLIVVAIKTSCFDGRWIIVLLLTAGFVTIIKPVGIYFAVAAILINFVATVFTVKFNSRRNVITAFVPSLASLLTIGAIWTTWRNYTLGFGRSNSGYDSVPTSFNSIINQQEVIGSFIKSFFQVALPSHTISIPSITWTILCGLLFVIWAYLNGYQNRKRNIYFGITLIITTIGYFCVILLSYLTVFSSGEAAGLASYDRYIGTWYQGIFFAIVLLILSEFDLTRDTDSVSAVDLKSKHPKRRSQVGAYLIALSAISSISSPNTYVAMLRTPQDKGIEWRAPFDPMLKAIEAAKIPNGSKVYIITQHKIGYEYYVLRYEMIGMQFGAVPFSIGSPYGEGDIWTEPTMNVEKWSKTLRDFDFVIMYITTESFNKEFSTIFQGGVVEINTVYKIEKLAKSVVLSKTG